MARFERLISPAEAFASAVRSRQHHIALLSASVLSSTGRQSCADQRSDRDKRAGCAQFAHNGHGNPIHAHTRTAGNHANLGRLSWSSWAPATSHAAATAAESVIRTGTGIPNAAISTASTTGVSATSASGPLARSHGYANAETRLRRPTPALPPRRVKVKRREPRRRWTSPGRTRLAQRLLVHSPSSWATVATFRVDHQLHGFAFVLRSEPPTRSSRDEHPLLRGVHETGSRPLLSSLAAR